MTPGLNEEVELKGLILNRVAHSDRRLQPFEVAHELSTTAGVSEGKVKRAMNELVLEGKLEFTFYGQAYVELPLEMSRAAR